MTTTAASIASSGLWNLQTVAVCGGEISLLKGGTGEPLMVLPRDNGHPPRHEFLDLLAADFSVYYPWLPGFYGGVPEAWEWLANVRDLAVVQRQLIVELGLERLALVGLGFGGWVAAEMATMGQERLDSLVLVAPMGIQPKRDYIIDQFLISTESYARAGFADDAGFDAVYGSEPGFEQLESWETDREMTSRVAWKPYMYNPSLPRLLGGVTTPALVVWGDSDRVVPLECNELYRSALPNVTLEVFQHCGHALDLEQPAALAAKVASFIRGAHRS